MSDCYYYYGYDYGTPYCDYEYFEPYTPQDGYEPVSYSEVPPEDTPNPSPDVEYIFVTGIDLDVPQRRRTKDTGDTDADEVINERYPCGLGEDALTVCAVENLEARDTDYIVLAVQVVKPVQVQSEMWTSASSASRSMPTTTSRTTMSLRQPRNSTTSAARIAGTRPLARQPTAEAAGVRRHRRCPRPSSPRRA